jgi:hypothetical protein
MNTDKIKAITRQTTIPENSIISNGFEGIDYCDAYRAVKPTSDSAEKIAAEIFNLPKWVNWLMNIRNSIAGVFGLKSSKETRERQTTFFAVIEKSENEIVMGENDKHLNFRVSVSIDRINSVIYLTTLVHFNNFLGRVYFFPVKPFHKIIVKSILRKNINKKYSVIN